MTTEEMGDGLSSKVQESPVLKTKYVNIWFLVVLVVLGVLGIKYYFFGGLLGEGPLSYKQIKNKIVIPIPQEVKSASFEILAHIPEEYRGKGSGPARISPDGRHTSSIIQYVKNLHHLFLIDGKESQYDLVYEAPYILAYSVDGKLAYDGIAKNNKNEQPNHFAVLDEKRMPSEYQRLLSVGFSPDGQTFFYTAQKAENSKVLVINGKEEPYSATNVSYGGISNPVFSLDSKRIAYTVLQNGKRHVVLNGKLDDKSYQFTEGLTFSSDGNHFAYVGTKDGPVVSYLVKDGVEKIINGDIVGAPSFNFDGSELSYSYVKFVSGRRQLLVTMRNDKEISSKPVVSEMLGGKPLEDFESRVFENTDDQLAQFSPDGKRFAYITSAGTNPTSVKVVLDGKESNSYWGINKISFSPNSKHFAYVVMVENPKTGGLDQFLVLDGNEKNLYPISGNPGHGRVEFFWSPDGEHLAYPSPDENDPHKTFLILDGKSWQMFGDYLGTIKFSPDSTKISYGVLRADDILWVTQSVN